MIGQFLEISVQTPDIQESVAFYTKLGFECAETGETWSHPYAVLTDGRLYIGLHQYDFQSPSLTYVRPGIADHLDLLQKHDIRFSFVKTGDDQFNEAGFCDPDGQIVTLLEARTFSPPLLDREDISFLGRFSQYTMPVSSVERAIAFWEPLGFVLTSQGDDPFPWAIITSDKLNIAFYNCGELQRPAITFTEPDMDQRIQWLAAKEYDINNAFPGADSSGQQAILNSPEGLDIHLITGG